MNGSATVQHRIGLASRALARAGLVHAYGHCSARVDARAFCVSPAKPLGLVTEQDSPVRVAVLGELTDGVLPEVRLHQAIYARRSDVRGIARFQAPNLMALSALGRTPRVLHGFGSYFAPAAPLHDDPRLVRDAARAEAVVDRLGDGRAVVLRGNGAVTAADSLEAAVVLAWYLEDAARVELAVLASGQPARVYTADESADRAITSGRLFERMWDWLTAGDDGRLLDAATRGS